MWRLIWAIPSWLIFEFCIDIPLMILGWPLIFLALICNAYEYNENQKIWHFTWPFMWIWDNYEDGVYAGRNYWNAPNMFLQIFWWSAIRNSTNNMRLVPWLNVMIDPKRVGFAGSFGDSDEMPKIVTEYSVVQAIEIRKYDTPVPQWFFAWQGFYTTWYWQFNLLGSLRRFWIGWKIYPTDIWGVTEYRKNGAGFAIQFKKVT